MSSHDVIVIGGGPAGATAAALLAKAGADVALFEMREFPRFQIGESLVPAVNLTLDRLGLREAVDARFTAKHGVQFISSSGPGRPFYFDETEDPRLHNTWQVLRSEFDALLIDNARDAGVEVSTATQVVKIHSVGDAVHGVEVRRAGADEERVDARLVLDGSGQSSLLARGFGERAVIPDLQNAAVYAHYKGVVRDEGRDAGSTLIYKLDGGSWVWFIPLEDVVSLGVVAKARRISADSRTPEELLEAAIAANPWLEERMVHAVRASEVRTVRDFTYRAGRDGGTGWGLIGDALGFMDPIYSTGLFLTMLSAELAADAAIERLRGGDGLVDMAGYSTSWQNAFDRFLPLIRAYYTEGFRFGELSRDAEKRLGLIDLLIGNVSTERAGMVSEVLEEMGRRAAS